MSRRAAAPGRPPPGLGLRRAAGVQAAAPRPEESGLPWPAGRTPGAQPPGPGRGVCPGTADLVRPGSSVAWVRARARAGAPAQDGEAKSGAGDGVRGRSAGAGGGVSGLGRPQERPSTVSTLWFWASGRQRRRGRGVPSRSAADCLVCRTSPRGAGPSRQLNCSPLN